MSQYVRADCTKTPGIPSQASLAPSRQRVKLTNPASMKPTIVSARRTLTLLALLVPILLADKMDDRVKKLMNTIPEETIEALPYGVMFKKIAVLDMSSSEWPHIIKIPQIPPLPPLPPYSACDRIPRISRLAEHYFENITIHQDYYERLEHRRRTLCAAYKDLAFEYNGLMLQVYNDGRRQYQAMKDLVLPNKQSNLELALQNRTRRDLSFLGELTGNFFGLATVSDAKKLRKAVNMIHDDISVIGDQFNMFKEDMISMSTLHTARISHIAGNLNRTMLYLNELTRTSHHMATQIQLDQFWNQLVHELLTRTFTEVSILQDAVLNYRQVIQDRTTAIGWLNDHLLTPGLISPEELRNTLKELEIHLMEHYPTFRFGFQSEQYFYRVPSTSYTADEDFLYIQVKIPLTVMAAHYHVYEVYTVPLPVTGENTQYTQISNLPQYAAFSIQGDAYSLIPQTYLNTCVGVGVQRCPSRQLEISTSVDSCVLGLFLREAEIIQKYCKVDLILTPRIHEMALDIGRGKFFISNVDPDQNWVIACPDSRPRSVPPCRSCIVTLQCKCTLKTSSAFISASLGGCMNMATTSGVDKAYVPNLMWIQRLANFTKEKLPLYNTTTVLKKDPIPGLPALPIPSYLDVQDFVEEDQEIKTSLDQVLKKVKSSKPMYVNKLQQLTSETEFRLFKQFHAIPLAFAGMIWNIILTVFIAYLVRRHRALRALVLSTVVTDDSDATTSESSPMRLSFGYNILLLYLTVVMTVLLLGWIGYLLWKKYQHLQEHRQCYPADSMEVTSARVILKLTMGSKLAMVHMDHLCIPQHQLKLNRPDTQGDLPVVRWISHRFTSKLLIEWKEICLQHKGTSLKIPLPTVVRIRRNLKYLVHSIIRAEHYTLSVIVKTGLDQQEFTPFLLAGKQSRPSRGGTPPVKARRMSQEFIPRRTFIKTQLPYIQHKRGPVPKPPRTMPQPRPRHRSQIPPIDEYIPMTWRSRPMPELPKQMDMNSLTDTLKDVRTTLQTSHIYDVPKGEPQTDCESQLYDID